MDRIRVRVISSAASIDDKAMLRVGTVVEKSLPPLLNQSNFYA